MKYILLTLAVTAVSQVAGHGRLMEPPARNAMWRYGFPNPVNYNDDELFCGGFQVHYQKNGGKCGVCGDNYQQRTPRLHEDGGIFGNGIIVRRFASGQVMNIMAELTTNHNGWMEVRLCPNNDPMQTVTQDCLDQYLLKRSGRSDPRFVIPEDAGKVVTFSWDVELPELLTCSQCVIQWKYITGCVGCGDQEVFINCADIEIYSNTTNISANVDNPGLLYYRGNETTVVKKEETVDKASELRPLIVRSQRCIPVGNYTEVDEMDDWCRLNCLKYPPNCPADTCRCVHECKAIGEFAKDEDSDIFCNQHCLGHPSLCPADKCSCF